MPLSAEIVESDSKKERECSSGPVPQKREQGRVCSYCCAREADELSAFLLLIESDNHYRVDEVMKRSASEVTERVTFVADNYVERGPFIRKYLKFGPGVGSAYAVIHQAQKQGTYLSHLPRIYAVYQLKDGVKHCRMLCFVVAPRFSWHKKHSPRCVKPFVNFMNTLTLP